MAREVRIVRHSSEELERRRRQILADLRVSGVDELIDESGRRELTVKEEEALDELRRITFLLGEE